MISAGDMTTEACTTKLAYIFGRGVTSLDEVARLMHTCLRGELSSADKSGKKFFEASSYNDFDGIKALAPKKISK